MDKRLLSKLAMINENVIESWEFCLNALPTVEHALVFEQKSSFFPLMNLEQTNLDKLLSELEES